MALTKAHNRMIAGSAVNVIDFGAVGDGVTDDTAAIQAAIDAIGVGQKGSVYFPAGTYIITDTINMNGIQGDFFGAGQSASYIKAGGSLLADTTKFMLYSTYYAGSNISGKINFRDFTLQGNDTAEGCKGLYISDVSDDVNIMNVTFLRFGNTMLFLQSHRVTGVQDYGYFSVEGVNVNNCVFYGASNHATQNPLVVAGQLNESTFRNCKFYGGAESGGSYPNSVLLWIYSGLGNVIDACSFANTQGTPIRLGHDDDPVALMDDGVSYYGSAVQGIKIINNTDFEKVGVMFADNTTNGDAFLIDASSDDGFYKYYNQFHVDRVQFPVNTNIRLNNIQQSDISGYFLLDRFSIDGSSRHNTFNLKTPNDTLGGSSTGNSVIKYGMDSVEVGKRVYVRTDYQNDDMISAISINAGGSSYVVGDDLTISGGNADAIARVTSVDGSGGVTGVNLRDKGTAYSTATGASTSGGTGSGCTIDIDAVMGGLLDDGAGSAVSLLTVLSDGTEKSYVMAFERSNTVNNGFKLSDDAGSVVLGAKASQPYIPHDSVNTGRPSTFGVQNGSIQIRDGSFWYFYDGGWYELAGTLVP